MRMFEITSAAATATAGATTTAAAAAAASGSVRSRAMCERRRLHRSSCWRWRTPPHAGCCGIVHMYVCGRLQWQTLRDTASASASAAATTSTAATVLLTQQQPVLQLHDGRLLLPWWQRCNSLQWLSVLARSWSRAAAAAQPIDDFLAVVMKQGSLPAHNMLCSLVYLGTAATVVLVDSDRVDAYSCIRKLQIRLSR